MLGQDEKEIKAIDQLSDEELEKVFSRFVTVREDSDDELEFANEVNRLIHIGYKVVSAQAIPTGETTIVNGDTVAGVNYIAFLVRE